MHYPRELSSIEREWIDLLLPESRAGYRSLRQHLDDALVLGDGRWGVGDLLIGRDANVELDLTEGMMPVAAYGEIDLRIDSRAETLTISLHQPNDQGIVELHSSLPSEALAGDLVVSRRWSYSHWSPGEPCPASGMSVREVVLDHAGTLRLVVSSGRRALWLYDAIGQTNTLIPITNFYNELMLHKGIRDPEIALQHRLLFDEPGRFADDELRGTFIRYNNAFRKVDAERLSDAATTRQLSRLERLRRFFGGNN